MNDSDTSLTLVRRIAARPQTVFDAMTSPEGIAHWWGPDAGPVLHAETDPREGGRWRVRFRMLDGSEHESHGVYSVFDPPHRFETSWRWLGDEDQGNASHIEVVLHAVGDGTELVFTHARLANAATRDDHLGGWTGCLEKLVAWLSSATKESVP